MDSHRDIKGWWTPLLWVALLGHWSVLTVGQDRFPGDRNFIDRHLREEWSNQALRPSPEADRRTLIRRLSYDLTGLPPHLNDGQLLSEDGLTSEVIDRYAERLLQSPRFGERMASMWMNVARYGEDQAHQVGNDVKHFYPNAHHYRDWVVAAFNRDLPYDEFIKLQLAADLYEGTVASDLPALGFLGLGPKYYNRGRLDVQADEWEDRVDTVTRGFLGLTVACARCHDHKFDPIPTEDYYALAGVFASTKMVNAPYGKDPAAITEEEKKKAIYTVHIVEEGEPRDLPVFVRGNVERKGEIVPRRFLSLFYPEGQEPPRFSRGSGRQELAEAIATEKNPLTAKVFVNRVWQAFFGRGLVATPSNFGALGEPATHPGLLQELADRFVASGWSTKWLVRSLVQSSAYRQGSAIVPEYQEVDPENRYLWRMARRRLPVEAWRDSLLVFADQLEDREGRSLRLDDPANHRRTLYGRVSRLKLDPLLANYDYPDPNVHSARRSVTTTPLQKLYSLNNPFVVDQARALAERIESRVEQGSARISFVYQLLFLREPTEEERDLAEAFLEDDRIESGTRWLLYAQALLSSNELAYLD